MERLTQRSGDTVVYIGNRTKIPGLDSAGSMRVAAVRECMDRLAEYEDTGFAPEELREVMRAVAETVPSAAERIASMLPQLRETIKTHMEGLTWAQINEQQEAFKKKLRGDNAQ